MRIRIIPVLAGAAAPAALAGVLLGTVGQASAAAAQGPAAAVLTANVQQTYTGKVSETGVPDTTFGGNAGNATEYSDYGPVWASDDITRNITVTPAGSGLWTVTFVENGTYHAFADPNDGSAWTNTGNMHGTVSYTVASATPPNMGNLPASLPGVVDQSNNNHQVMPSTGSTLAGLTVHGHGYIIGQLFPNNQGVTGGPWNYHYTQIQDVPGVYQQVG
jgi:hypothetical protein